MSIPTYEERMAAKFGDELRCIKESINDAILTGYQHYHNRGYGYYTAGVGKEWPDEELRKWLIKEYKAAGWGLDFVWADPDNESGDCRVEIYMYAGE